MTSYAKGKCRNSARKTADEMGTTPAIEARQGALEIELPPHSAAIYR